MRTPLCVRSIFIIEPRSTRKDGRPNGGMNDGTACPPQNSITSSANWIRANGHPIVVGGAPWTDT
jgi:uncharacterized Zn-binding protein involved in type VI secretion